MKKIFLTLLTGLFISLSAFSQNYSVTVYGTVMVVVQNTISPVPNQPVNITIDSTGFGFTYQNTVYTDESGYYEDVVEIPGYSGYGYVHTSTFDSCLGYYQYNYQELIPGATLIPMDFYLCNTIYPECQASFYYYQLDPVDPNTYAFVNSSFGNYTDVTWSFGDSTYSNEINPIHTFPGEGTYYVCLTISDGGDCNSTYCEEVYTGYPPPPSDCESFIIPVSMYGLTVEFQGYTISPFETTYTWEFGDGVTGTGEFVSHTYPAPGMYNVYLNTMDANGCTFQTFTQIWLDSLYQGCSNYFTYEQADSSTLTFTGVVYLNNGMTFPDSASVYSWDFGDGTSGTGQTVTHYFQGNPSGGYTVCLTTSTILPDGSACTALYCEPVLIGAPSFNIFGYVYLENNLTADQALVHLMTMDTLWQGVIEVQSTTIDSGGFYNFPEIPMYNSRLYFVQAELTEGSAYFGEYVPTYHISALNWEQAMPILPLENWPAEIFMIPGSPVEGGNGTITGVVTELGTRGFMNDVEVVLMDEESNPLMYLRSDDQGNFEFANLPYDTYIIHAELMGIHTVQAQITLNEENPVASVEVQVSGGEANFVFGLTEQAVIFDRVGDIYPNPVNDNAKLDLTVKKPVDLAISIFGQTGQLMNSSALSLNEGTHSVDLQMGNLPAGLYLLRISTAQGELVSRKFMKVQ